MLKINIKKLQQNHGNILETISIQNFSTRRFQIYIVQIKGKISFFDENIQNWSKHIDPLQKLLKKIKFYFCLKSAKNRFKKIILISASTRNI